uniref:Uncharacterized protein n=1 Tax=Klebsiella pneumoniae TaxID=573 RepID=A0A8B0SUZ9_KLEPN|nr:hypothetical protein [Klebsiella pneumoniae]
MFFSFDNVYPDMFSLFAMALNTVLKASKKLKHFLHLTES